MSQKSKLSDILGAEEISKVAELKKEMFDAPSKFEVNAIASEIYEIYETAKGRSTKNEEQKVASLKNAKLKPHFVIYLAK